MVAGGLQGAQTVDVLVVLHDAGGNSHAQALAIQYWGPGHAMESCGRGIEAVPGKRNGDSDGRRFEGEMKETRVVQRVQNGSSSKQKGPPRTGRLTTFEIWVQAIQTLSQHP